MRVLSTATFGLVRIIVASFGELSLYELRIPVHLFYGLSLTSLRSIVWIVSVTEYRVDRALSTVSIVVT